VSAVVYVRVPDALKQALKAHAAAHASTQTAAAAQLLGQGLQASAKAQPLAELEAQLADCRSEHDRTRTRLEQAELRLQAAREREQTTAHTHSAFAARLRQPLAACPRCRQPVTGADLLLSGHCRNCTTSLSALLLPTPRAGFASNDYLTLLGALGLLAGLALASADSAAA